MIERRDKFLSLYSIKLDRNLLKLKKYYMTRPNFRTYEIAVKLLKLTSIRSKGTGFVFVKTGDKNTEKLKIPKK